jgi:hypothetical protein
VAPADSGELLADLVRLRREALCSPLPYAERTTHALAWALHHSLGAATGWTDAPAYVLEQAATEAEKQWDPEYDPDERAESKQSALRLALDGRAPFREPDGETPSLAFVRVAERIWRPLFQAIDRAENQADPADRGGGDEP